VGLDLCGGVLLIGVGKTAYDAGYKAGKRDLIDPPHLRPLTEDQRTQSLMRATLPWWRRWLGFPVVIVSNIGLTIYLFWAMVHYRPSGWVVFFATILSLFLMGLSFWLMERLWKPFRDAQTELRRSRTRSTT
jgi:hypothetical protein